MIVVYAEARGVKAVAIAIRNSVSKMICVWQDWVYLDIAVTIYFFNY